ncbi:hypothetical protein DWS25_03760 [Escherichia coli]|nr:hypothetical protein [Escherichia coli]EKB8112744.1 hypothetical protein [Escherichia coli]ELT2129254.1 hypothetical protein [Escherichia coli]HEI3480550.1 hypothetical protein [Escherichia coli]
MRHEFDVLAHAENDAHAKSVATKTLKLDYVEKQAISDLADAVNERGSLELIQPGGFDELMRFYFAGGDGNESFICGVEARTAAIAALLRIMREPHMHHIVGEIIRIARDLEMPVEDPFDC